MRRKEGSSSPLLPMFRASVASAPANFLSASWLTNTNRGASRSSLSTIDSEGLREKDGSPDRGGGGGAGGGGLNSTDPNGKEKSKPARRNFWRSVHDRHRRRRRQQQQQQQQQRRRKRGGGEDEKEGEDEEEEEEEEEGHGRRDRLRRHQRYHQWHSLESLSRILGVASLVCFSAGAGLTIVGFASKGLPDEASLLFQILGPVLLAAAFVTFLLGSVLGRLWKGEWQKRQLEMETMVRVKLEKLTREILTQHHQQRFLSSYPQQQQLLLSQLSPESRGFLEQIPLDVEAGVAKMAKRSRFISKPGSLVSVSSTEMTTINSRRSSRLANPTANSNSNSNNNNNNNNNTGNNREPGLGAAATAILTRSELERRLDLLPGRRSAAQFPSFDLPGIQISRIETLDLDQASGGSSCCSAKRYIIVHSDVASSDFSFASEYSLLSTARSRSRSRSSNASLFDFSPRDSEWDADVSLGSRDSQASILTGRSSISGRELPPLGFPRQYFPFHRASYGQPSPLHQQQQQQLQQLQQQHQQLRQQQQQHFLLLPHGSAAGVISVTAIDECPPSPRRHSSPVSQSYKRIGAVGGATGGALGERMDESFFNPEMDANSFASRLNLAARHPYSSCSPLLLLKPSCSGGNDNDIDDSSAAVDPSDNNNNNNNNNSGSSNIAATTDNNNSSCSYMAASPSGATADLSSASPKSSETTEPEKSARSHQQQQQPPPPLLQQLHQKSSMATAAAAATAARKIGYLEEQRRFSWLRKKSYGDQSVISMKITEDSNDEEEEDDDEGKEKKKKARGRTGSDQRDSFETSTPTTAAAATATVVDLGGVDAKRDEIEETKKKKSQKSPGPIQQQGQQGEEEEAQVDPRWRHFFDGSTSMAMVAAATVSSVVDRKRACLKRNTTDDSEVERRVAKLLKEIEFSATDSLDDCQSRTAKDGGPSARPVLNFFSAYDSKSSDGTTSLSLRARRDSFAAKGRQQQTTSSSSSSQPPFSFFASRQLSLHRSVRGVEVQTQTDDRTDEVGRSEDYAGGLTGGGGGGGETRSPPPHRKPERRRCSRFAQNPSTESSSGVSLQNASAAAAATTSSASATTTDAAGAAGAASSAQASKEEQQLSGGAGSRFKFFARALPQVIAAATSAAAVECSRLVSAKNFVSRKRRRRQKNEETDARDDGQS